MKASIVAGAAAAVLALSATTVFAQVSDKPFQENWAPSKWGKDDSAGSRQSHQEPGERQARNQHDQAVQSP